MEWETKVWGRVAHLFYSDQLGVSYLQVTSGFCCSWHLHHWRANAFLVKSGKLLIEQRGQKDVILAVGESIVIPSRVDHRFCVLESGEVIETYWPDREGQGVKLNDIHRWDEGGPYDPRTGYCFSLQEASGADVYYKPRPFSPYIDKGGPFQFGAHYNPSSLFSGAPIGILPVRLATNLNVPRIAAAPTKVQSIDISTLPSETIEAREVAEDFRPMPSAIKLSELVDRVFQDSKERLQQASSQEVRTQLEKYCGG
jgi:mannose-6-phosphate isomerase-like protein (cupin superfamily)